MATRDDLDEPDRTVGLIPGFSRNPGPGMTALTPAPQAMDPVPFNLSPLSDGDDASPAMDTDLPEVPRLDRGTRTGTSGTSDGAKPATAKDVTTLVVAAVGALAVAASMFVRWRSRGTRKLRRPDDGQADAIGAPLGRILARHIPLPALVPDLRDGILAAVAVTDYLDAGPLTLYQGADPGLPPDLNQETPV